MITLAQTLATLASDTPFCPPENWLQGRTAYGGLSAALSLQVLRSQHPDLPPLKAAQFSFVGPVTEGAVFTPSVLRRGKSVVQAAVETRVGADTVARAAFVFGAPRESIIDHVAGARPEVEGPDACRTLPEDAMAPGHFRNFDVRFVGDSLPLSSSAHPELLAWVRLKNPEDVSPDVALLALGDCLPPAAMACFPRPAPISSVTWSLDLPQAARPSPWFLQRSRSLSAADGYSFQLMETWNLEGERVLISTQTVALFI